MKTITLDFEEGKCCVVKEGEKLKVPTMKSLTFLALYTMIGSSSML